VKIDGYDMPEDLYYYPESFLWVRKESDTKAVVGLTDFAQQQAGKVSFIRIRPKGFQLEVGKVFGTMESFKWIGALRSPLKGFIESMNEDVAKNPNIVKESPYERGWLIRVEYPSSDDSISKLLTKDAATKWMEDEIRKAKARSIT